MTTQKQMTKFPWKTSLFSAATLGVLCFAGCDRQEKVLDIETPGTDIEVHKDVDPEPDPPKKVIDIDAPGTDVEINKTDNNDGDAKVKVRD